MTTKRHKHHGLTLDEFLSEEGLTEEVDAIVQKRVLAAQLRAAMEELGLSEVKLAKRMDTSRTAVRNLLSPSNDSATLISLVRAARAVGRELRVELVAPKPTRKRKPGVTKWRDIKRRPTATR